MRIPALLLLVASLLVAIVPPAQNPKDAVKLWAGISVNTPPLFHQIGPQKFLRQPGPEKLLISFAVVNEGAMVVDPDIGSSKLFVNGKEFEGWRRSISNGPRDKRFEALPPGDYLLFAYDLTRHFHAPGTYSLYWKGKDFQSAEIMFRVLPKQDLKERKQAGRLWAGISVSRPVIGDYNPEKVVISLAVMNDGEQMVSPAVESSELVVNGKVLKDPAFKIANPPKDNRFGELPPGAYFLFSYDLSEQVQAPGTYKLCWKGEKFESPEIAFRVLPKEAQ